MSNNRPTLLSSLFSSRKSFKDIPKAAKATSPLVKTVQAVEGIINAGQLIYNANETAANLNEFIPKASNMMDRVDAFVPSMQIMGQSFCDSVKILTSFSTIATTVGIGANVVLTYQGIQALNLIAARLGDVSATLAAQTALIAQKDFPQYVYDMIRERLGQTADDTACEHWFFVYHPDNDWYPKFYHLLEARPLGPAFCGYTNQIDTVFSFMIAARRYIQERERRPRKDSKMGKPVTLHLLVPAYQPVVIVEALKIPEEIGDFVIEGRVNSNKPFVWMNLPDDQKKYTLDIGDWEPPTPSWWATAMATLGLGEEPLVLKEPRVLGTSQHRLPIDSKPDAEFGKDDTPLIQQDSASDDLVVMANTKDEEQSVRRNATPLHQRRRKHSKKQSGMSQDKERTHRKKMEGP
ncbi:hypothetical protein DM02DRAFT_609178 [Periconia macrospinosa]|uniref:Uncharacterized protein n=1 Tax=Periconia macrospinosa TaxID=97972 RepID=A0A2V1EAY3_9PLEO|nr:hypothetical protein DM02DRAFT_609178 [Periconia macrospinosa]